MSACVYSVYLDDVHVKAFTNRADANTCAIGIKIWLDKVGLDAASVHSVHVEEEC